MLDFNKLVFETLLFEVSGTPAAAETRPEEEVIAKGLYDGYLKGKYSELKQLFATKYKDLYNNGVIFPSEEEFENIVYNVCKNSIRTTKDSSVFPDIRNTFPLLDLISRLKNITKDKKDIRTHIPELDAQYKSFVTTIQDKKSGVLPLDYSPIDSWARSVLFDFYKKNSNNIVSQLTLDKLQDKSILQAVMELLAIRKAGWITRIDKRVAPRIKSSATWVSDLIFNFQQYGSGQVKVPGEFSLLYDQVTPTNLVAIGSAAYEYYLSEAKRLNHELEETKKMEGYKAFIQNKPLVLRDGDTIFDWSSYVVSTSATKAETPTSESKIFDKMYNRLSNLILEFPQDVLDNIARATERESQNTTQNQNEPPSVPSTVADEQKPQEFDGGYIIKNVSKDTELYKKLLGLTEYIKTSTSFADKLSKVTGALQSAAQGARAALGGNRMGG